uniref:Uncharacterized protein n=1 Tax=Oryza brachyantha TaxID=4533 RepID=J3L7V0_ORYBR
MISHKYYGNPGRRYLPASGRFSTIEGNLHDIQSDSYAVDLFLARTWSKHAQSIVRS